MIIVNFKEAIELYENQIKKQNKRSTSLAVNQALKACIELDDIKRAKDISQKSISFYEQTIPLFKLI